MFHGILLKYRFNFNEHFVVDRQNVHYSACYFEPFVFVSFFVGFSALHSAFVIVVFTSRYIRSNESSSIHQRYISLVSELMVHLLNW